MDVQVGAQQTNTEWNMPSHLRQKLEQSQKFRKGAMSADEREKRAMEVQARRDEELAKKAQKAIEAQEKHFDPTKVNPWEKRPDVHI